MTNAPGPFPGTALINGNPLPRAPKWQTNFTLRYSIPMANGDVYALTDWAYRSSYNMFLYEAKEYKAKPLLEGGPPSVTSGLATSMRWPLLRATSLTKSR